MMKFNLIPRMVRGDIGWFMSAFPKLASLFWALGDLTKRIGELSDDPCWRRNITQKDPWVQWLSHLVVCAWERSVELTDDYWVRGCFRVLWKWIFNYSQTIHGLHGWSMGTLPVGTKCWLWFCEVFVLTNDSVQWQRIRLNINKTYVLHCSWCFLRDST